MAFDNNTIDSIENLYGRKDLVETFLTLAKENTNAALIGCRRFGKTCMFKTLEKIMRKENSPCYPIYLDFMEFSHVSDTEANFRYLISVLVSNLCKDEVFTDKETFCENIEIYPHTRWQLVYQQLEHLDSVIIGAVMEELITTMAGLLEKPIILLIDEYEYLMKYSLRQSADFSPIRTLSTQTLPNGQKVLLLWVAGADSWENTCQNTGSPALNTIATTKYLKPLDKQDFLEMWRNETNYCEDETTKELLGKFAEEAFNKSGGVAYYGKAIGKFIIVNKEMPTYDEFSSYIVNIDKRFNPEQRKILKQLSSIPRNQPDTPNLKDLLKRGIVDFDSKKKVHFIKMGYLIDYMKTQDFHDVVKFPITYEKANEVCKYIEMINHTYEINGKEVIFIQTNDLVSLSNDLQTLCVHADELEKFALSVYKMYLERSVGERYNEETGRKEQIFGYRLPWKFSKTKDPENPSKGMFARAVDRLRQSQIHLWNNSSPTGNQVSEAEMLEYFTGSTKIPATPQEYLQFQIAVLDKFIGELKAMKEYVDNCFNKK